MIKRFFRFVLLAIVVIGNGIAPPNAHSDAQAKMMARRAAIVDCQRQMNGQAFHILEESFNGSVYTIRASVN